VRGQKTETGETDPARPGSYFEEQLEHALEDEEQDVHAEGLPVPPEPDQENVLMSLCVRESLQEGQGTGSSRFPSTISSKRSPQPSH